MRRSTLVHRFRPEGDDDGFDGLRDAGFVVELGPGLVAGTPLLDRVLARIEAGLLDALAALGVARAHLPACEGEALVNLLAHLGWAGARHGVAAFGTGFRAEDARPEGLAGLALYPRLDVVRLETGADGSLADAVLAALAGLGLEELSCGSADTAATPGGAGSDAPGSTVPAGPDAPSSAGSSSAASDAADPDAVEVVVHELRAGDAPLGRVTRRALAAGGPADAVRLLELDLYATVGALARRHADERGLRWPAACAPFAVALVAAAGGDPVAAETARKLETELEAAGVDVLRDDTDEPAAAQRRAAERLGIPWRVLCGPTCAEGVVVLERRAGGTPERVPVGDVLTRVAPDASHARGGAGRERRARRLRALY